jgi:type IV pilus assembly protein PilM
MLFGKSKDLVGLDIGSNSIKVVELKRGKNKFELASMGVAPLSPDVIVDGALMNSSAIVDAITGLMAELKIKNKQVATSISGTSVIIKKISLPVMTRQELQENIQWEAEQYIPFDINDVNVDFHILGEAGEEQGKMGVILVAAKKDLVNDYTGVIAEAGLTPLCVDIDAFAAGNSLEWNYPERMNEIIALVNVGASVTNINVIKNGVSTFVRDITSGGNAVTEMIQKNLGIQYEEAEKLKRAGQDGSDEMVPTEVSDIIRQVSQTIASEIARSLDFYSATNIDDRISKIYISGGMALTAGLDSIIERTVGYPVEVMNPMNNITVGKKVDAGELAKLAPALSVAVGLAMRRTNDA